MRNLILCASPANHTIFRWLSAVMIALILTPTLAFSGLVAEWRMDEPIWVGDTREVLDSSGNGLHGTALGRDTVPTTALAKVCNGGRLRGQGFNIPAPPWWINAQHQVEVRNDRKLSSLRGDQTDMQSISGWFRAESLAGGRYALIHKGQSGDQEYLVQIRNRRLQVVYWDRNQTERTVQVNFPLQEGQWYFFGSQARRRGRGANLDLTLFLFDSSIQLIGSSSETFHQFFRGPSNDYDSRPHNAHLRLGAIRFGQATHFLDGYLDEIRIHNTALNQDDFAALAAQTRDCPSEGQALNHIRLEHSGAGLTCQAEPITVRACADADCSQLFADPVTVNFTSPAGNWTPSSLRFTGEATVGLQVTQPGRVELNADSNPPAPVRYFVGALESCAMYWAESGFVIDLPDHISATTADGVIRAVRASDDAQACVPAFADVTRPVNLWSEYLNPDSGLAAVTVNNATLPPSYPGTAISLDFDGNGAASLTVVYPDAGRVRVQARFAGTGDEAGLVMTGQGQFVARPAQLVVVAIDGNPETDTATGPVFRAAGESFDVRVRALNEVGHLTGNFGRESAPETATVGLDHELVAPAGGHQASLVGNLNAFGQDCTGQPGGIPGEACGQFQWHEVGSVRLTPVLISGPYLGFEAIPGASSAAVGRFIPSHFRLGGYSLTNRAALASCNSDFTYLGEALGAEFTLIAQSTNDQTTHNYEGDFARMNASQLNLAASPTPDISNEVLTWSQGMGSASAFLTPPRNAPDGPYDPYTVTTAAGDSDNVSLTGNNSIGTTRLLFGRMVIDNAIGSELGPLDLPWRVEVWEDATWRVHGADNCTALGLDQQISLSNGHGALVSGAEMIAVNAAGDMTSIDAGASELTAVGGRGHFRLAAPLAPGWVEVLLGLDNGWQFLRDDLGEPLGEYDDNPTARATWGLFDGNSNRILLREVIPR